ncbi:hypothetical protein BJ165DRAFT_610101 [Panaeolus papilionaceus]|nr:hypothetical protein BJ165DRAFT_610101 [Panaeolus papilionaceus]
MCVQHIISRDIGWLTITSCPLHSLVRSIFSLSRPIHRIPNPSAPSHLSLRKHKKGHPTTLTVQPDATRSPHPALLPSSLPTQITSTPLIQSIGCPKNHNHSSNRPPEVTQPLQHIQIHRSIPAKIINPTRRVAKNDHPSRNNETHQKTQESVYPNNVHHVIQLLVTTSVPKSKPYASFLFIHPDLVGPWLPPCTSEATVSRVGQVRL